MIIDVGCGKSHSNAMEGENTFFFANEAQNKNEKKNNSAIMNKSQETENIEFSFFVAVAVVLCVCV